MSRTQTRAVLTPYSNPTYKDLRVNEPLCQCYVDEMAYLGETIDLRQDECFTASTDMGKSPRLCETIPLMKLQGTSPTRCRPSTVGLAFPRNRT